MNGFPFPDPVLSEPFSWDFELFGFGDGVDS
jgi:hypothetical protein